ncbi:MAG TPA: acyltransferase [Candidatus Binatus sp.]|jgi:peptidoglycan/LPS O-acetylase OafA/YrhL|nr:acyltransferase [Candidatus Binatus sp.]
MTLGKLTLAGDRLRVPERPFALTIAPLRGRIPALDGLRGIAILLVLLWHAVFNGNLHSTFLPRVFALGSLTWSGVDLFFVLSGFLIGGILLDAKHSTRYFRTFYLRRAFRILPLYSVVTGIYLFRHLFSPGSSVIPLGSYPTFTQNFWMAYLGTFGTSAMAATWSLAVEEQFYLTIPPIVKELSRSRLVWVLAFIVIGAPLLRTLLLFTFAHDRFADYVLMPCRADDLCLGVLSAILVRDPEAWKFLTAKRSWLRGIAVALLVGLGWLAIQNYDESATPMVTFGYSLLGLFYTCCLLMALTETGMVNRVLCNRRLMELGGIAYCLYLVHLPLIMAGRSIPAYLPALSRLPIPHAIAIEALFGGLIGVILSAAVAKVSWRFLEQPMLRRGHAYQY